MSDVVHVYKDFPPVFGGIENHIATLARAQAERGLEVDVLCSGPPGLDPGDDLGAIRVHRCRAWSTLASTPLPPGLPLALRRSDARLIHLHYPWPPAEAAWLVAGRGRPLVVTVHCEVVRYPRLAQWIGPLTQRVLGAASAIVVTSEAMRRTPILAPHADRVRVVPCGLDLTRFRPADSEDPVATVPHPRIVFVGRLRHYKGLPALAGLLQRLPSAHLVVVGDGPERAAFESALDLAGCRDRAHLLGDVVGEVLVRVLQHADVAVLPSTSRAEALGISIVEAQSCGVPAVVTDVGTGTTTTVADGQSGRIVPPGDVDAFAAAVAWCLAPEGAGARRRAARQHAERHFSAARMAERIDDVYAHARS